MRKLKYLFLLTIFMVTKSFSQVYNLKLTETTGKYKSINEGKQLDTTKIDYIDYDNDVSNFTLAFELI
jgi:hypothetical protein